MHIEATNDPQRVLLDKLVETVARERWARKNESSVLVVTGDLFDSGTDRPDDVVPLFLDSAPDLLAPRDLDEPTSGQIRHHLRFFPHLNRGSSSPV